MHLKLPFSRIKCKAILSGQINSELFFFFAFLHLLSTFFSRAIIAKPLLSCSTEVLVKQLRAISGKNGREKNVPQLRGKAVILLAINIEKRQQKLELFFSSKFAKYCCKISG